MTTLKNISIIKHLMLFAAVALVPNMLHAGKSAPDQTAIMEEIYATPEKAGGIYLAYPVTADSLPTVPQGYKTVYISHYGRHGSRWAINGKTYSRGLATLSKALEDNNLTPEGKRVKSMVEKCAANAEGHLGELTAMGQRQHRSIAGRMARRFPEILKNGEVNIHARSSEVPRCIISMASFLNELTLANPQVRLDLSSSPGGMDTLALHIPKDKIHLTRDNSGDPPVKAYKELKDSLTMSRSTASKIFKNPDAVEDLPQAMRDIFDAAIAVQNVDGLAADILGVFEPEDLYDQWKSSNFGMYMQHANTAATIGAGPRSAVPLLDDIIKKADASLAGNGAPVELRFGHDTVLIRLLALMGADGAGGTTIDPDEAAVEWQSFEVSPMGANLQMVFFRNPSGNIIVSLRLNEQPLRIGGLKEAYPGYYNWADLREHLASAIHPVAALTERVSPGSSSQFIFRQTDSKEDYFEISSKDGRIVIEGNNPVNIAAGLNWYLKYYPGIHLSWNNMTTTLPDNLPLPSKPERHNAKVAQRYYLNYCTHSYSMAFWDFDRWQKEIDWMALHGINMPLAITGTDVVWRNTLRRLGYSDKEANEFVAGPAFQAWWLMNNLEGWGGPNSEQWYADRLQLQKDILAAMKEYGMEPVLPGYSGMVPHDAGERLGVEAMGTGKWNGFIRPAFLKTTDPMFDKIADIYYQELEKVCGKAKYYSMDPFHEGEIADGVNLTEAGSIITAAMKRANPESVWVIQGWNENPRKELLDGVAKGDIVVLDLASEIKPNWGDPDSPSLTKRSDGYAPHDWMFCMLLNFGGNVGLHGRMDNVIEGYYKALDSRYANDMTGFGLTPEGIENNPVMYELASELIWRPEKFTKESWLKGYARARYGASDSHVDKAWKQLSESIYNCPWGNMQQGTTESVFCARPSKEVWQVSSWSRMAPYYKPEAVIAAAKNFAKAASKLGGNSNYRYDLVDITRQAVAEKGRLTYHKMIKALNERDQKTFDKESAEFLRLIKEQDRLLSTNAAFSVEPWLEAARSLAHTDEEKDLMESNARHIITTWGPREASEEGGLRDYAHREWSGLLGDLYYTRWATWIEAMKKGDATPIDFYPIDAKWVNSRDDYKLLPESQSIPTALEILKTL